MTPMAVKNDAFGMGPSKLHDFNMAVRPVQSGLGMIMTPGLRSIINDRSVEGGK
jgi:hypothetical protein